jgi:hypothetical protein
MSKILISILLIQSESNDANSLIIAVYKEKMIKIPALRRLQGSHPKSDFASSDRLLKAVAMATKMPPTPAQFPLEPGSCPVMVTELPLFMGQLP